MCEVHATLDSWMAFKTIRRKFHYWVSDSRRYYLPDERHYALDDKVPCAVHEEDVESTLWTTLRKNDVMTELAASMPESEPAFIECYFVFCDEVISQRVAYMNSQSQAVQDSMYYGSSSYYFSTPGLLPLGKAPTSWANDMIRKDIELDDLETVTLTHVTRFSQRDRSVMLPVRAALRLIRLSALKRLTAPDKSKAAHACLFARYCDTEHYFVLGRDSGEQMYVLDHGTVLTSKPTAQQIQQDREWAKMAYNRLLVVPHQGDYKTCLCMTCRELRNEQ